MRIAIVAQYNPNMFPALHYLATWLARLGHEVQFYSAFQPTDTGTVAGDILWVPIKSVKGLAARIPLLRSSYWAIFRSLAKFRPDVIVGEHEYIIPGLMYGMLPGSRGTRVAAYFCDYNPRARGLSHVERWAGRLTAYVDVCELRLGWRKRDWPQMRAKTFVVHQSPLLRLESSIEPHSGPPRVIYTGSRNTLALNRNRLSRFLQRLCESGSSVDWYLAGGADVQSSHAVRAEARALCQHHLFTVKEPVPKSRLAPTLRSYDAGLFWGPMAELNTGFGFDKSYFLSAASNKIGEYLAAGLVVAHTGNPGLAYLPENACVAFDPTDPIAGANELAVALADRGALERKRAEALRYHREEMNFEAQMGPFVEFIANDR